MKKILFLSLLMASGSSFSGSKYDQEMLKSLGYDASAADLLEAGARFLPGDHPTSIIVNKQNKGVHVITFDQFGTPCWSEALLQTLGISPRRFVDSGQRCLNPAVGSEIRVIERVDRSTLELMVPANSLLNDVQYATHGRALIVNYDARRYEYQTRTGDRRSSHNLTSEIGANIDHWIFRSAQSVSSQDNHSHVTRLYTYVQRSVLDWASVVQIGELNASDPLFPGMTLLGAQMVPEQALKNGGANHVSLEILMPQSGTAEVWQDDILLKTFQVSAGINTLEGIPALSQQSSFVVVSHDNSGNLQRQAIPYIQATPDIVLPESGTSLAAGRLRLTPQEYPLLLGSTGIYQNSLIAVVAGGLIAEDYQAAAWRSNLRLNDRLRGSVSQTWSVAHDTSNGRETKQGVSHLMSMSYPVTQRLSLTSSANFRSRGYMEAGSAWSTKKTAEEMGQIKSQYAAGININQPGFGVLSFSGSLSHSWQQAKSRGYALGWGRSFGDVNVNLGIQKNRLTDDQRRYDNRYTYLNFSLPLGASRSLRSWVNNNGQHVRTGAGYDQTINDKFAWSLSGEKAREQDPSVAASATWSNKYSQLSGGISRGEDSTSYNVGALGGMVLHREGLTFTPRKVGDTVGIISLNSDRSDVEIRTPAGKVWSDGSGHAITSWTPWQKNTVHINNATLPKNVQVSGGVAEVTPYRGSVVPVALPTFTVRRALVAFAGEGPAPGSPVKNEKGELIAFVNEDGTLFFDDLPQGPLVGQRRDGAPCAIEFTTPWVDPQDSLYASLSARCLS